LLHTVPCNSMQMQSAGGQVLMRKYSMVIQSSNDDQKSTDHMCVHIDHMSCVLLADTEQ